MNGNNGSKSYDLTYFDSFGVELILKDHRNSKKLIKTKNIITNIHRIQSFDSIMCGWFCIEVIDSMLESKSLVDCTNLFSPNDYAKKW